MEGHFPEMVVGIHKVITATSPITEAAELHLPLLGECLLPAGVSMEANILRLAPATQAAAVEDTVVLRGVGQAAVLSTVGNTVDSTTAQVAAVAAKDTRLHLITAINIRAEGHHLLQGIIRKHHHLLQGVLDSHIQEAAAAAVVVTTIHRIAMEILLLEARLLLIIEEANPLLLHHGVVLLRVIPIIIDINRSSSSSTHSINSPRVEKSW